MTQFPRRQFLQTSSLLLGGSWLHSALAADAPNVPTFAPQAKFDPEIVLLSWQSDPTTSMTIQWVGKENEAAERLIWSAAAGAMDWRSTPPTKHQMPMTDLWIFRTELTGLKPGSEYRFRIGLDSPEYKFMTVPAKLTDSFQFVSGGDSGIDQHAQATNRVAAAQVPWFVFMGGDLAYENGRDPKTFVQFLKNYSQQVRTPDNRLIPMVACIGNHEVNGSYGHKPSSAPFFYAMFGGFFKDGGYGVLDFGDYLSLVLLDSNHTTPVAGEQTSWLDKTLKERQERPHVLVGYHVPSYPSVRDVDLDHNEKGVGIDTRKHWVPLFERYNVDAVMEHHDHAFKRSHPLMGSQVSKNGIVYLGDGSWGKIRLPKTPEQRPYLAVSKQSYHLSVHRLEAVERFHLAISDTGKVVDACTTTKRART
ncbi:MAG: metallophosphoesterase family protein [Planctomycetales bacterium]